MKKTTGNKVQSIPVGDIKGTELLVDFYWEIIKHPKRIEEGHGLHPFNEDETNFTINSVAFIFCGVERWRKSGKILTPKETSDIEDVLDTES